MNSKPEREISKNVLEFDVNTEYKTDLITGMNFSLYFLGSYHTVKKSQETKIAKHPPRFLTYGVKRLDKGVAASKKILALCLF